MSLVWGIHESLHPAQTALQRPTQQRLAEECLSEDWIELTPMGTKQLVDGSSWRTASDSYTSHSSGVSWGGHPKMGAKSRKVLTTNRLLKGPHWATLSREDYLLGSAEFCILKLGLSRASCYRKNSKQGWWVGISVTAFDLGHVQVGMSCKVTQQRRKEWCKICSSSLSSRCSGTHQAPRSQAHLIFSGKNHRDSEGSSPSEVVLSKHFIC